MSITPGGSPAGTYSQDAIEDDEKVNIAVNLRTEGNKLIIAARLGGHVCTLELDRGGDIDDAMRLVENFGDCVEGASQTYLHLVGEDEELPANARVLRAEIDDEKKNPLISDEEY